MVSRLSVRQLLMRLVLVVTEDDFVAICRITVCGVAPVARTHPCHSFLWFAPAEHLDTFFSLLFGIML